MTILGCGVSLVLRHGGVVGPAGHFAETGDDAACPMLALIAVNEHGVILAVEKETDDLVHDAVRACVFEILCFSRTGNHAMCDVVLGHEDFVGFIGRSVCNQGDYCLETKELETFEVCSLRVARAIDARPDLMEIDRQSCPVRRRRLRSLVLGRNGHTFSLGRAVFGAVVVLVVDCRVQC